MDEELDILDNELIVVSSVKEITSEFRFFIVNNEVVGSSQYLDSGYYFLSNKIPTPATELANFVSTFHWQSDKAYVCDIAMLENCPKIIELNAFSASDFYLCDVVNILKKMEAK